jgi:protein-tyrosine phosphatase
MRQVAGRQLWIGHAGDLRDARAILDAGIAAVVELADSEPHAVLPRDLIRCRFPLSDDAHNPPWLIRLAMMTVAELLTARIPVLICCSAGMSRSVCTAAAGLASAEKMSFDDALKVVIGTGPADVSPGFHSQMLSYFQ